MCKKNNKSYDHEEIKMLLENILKNLENLESKFGKKCKCFEGCSCDCCKPGSCCEEGCICQCCKSDLEEECTCPEKEVETSVELVKEFEKSCSIHNKNFEGKKNCFSKMGSNDKLKKN